MSEPYHLQITARAARDLQRLPEKIATACVEFIFGPRAENPRQVGKPLRDELVGLWSARRGDYRIGYAIVEATRSIPLPSESAAPPRRGRHLPVTLAPV